MKKAVLLFGFIGLCLASPYLQVSEKDNNDLKTKEAALLALGADFIDDRGCKGATLSGLIKARHVSRISGSNPGDVYNLHLTIKRADGTSLPCITRTTIYDSGVFGVNFCNCTL